MAADGDEAGRNAPEKPARGGLDRLFDFEHPFFRPLWLRIAIVLVCLGWAGLEIAAGSAGWAMLFGGLGLFSGYRFFFGYRPRDKP